MKIEIDTRLNKPEDKSFIFPIDIYESYGLHFNFHDELQNNITINWGDKTRTSLKANTKVDYSKLVHEYNEPGEYTITVTGILPCMCFYPNYDEQNNSLKVIEITDIEMPLNKKLDYMFYGCVNLKKVLFADTEKVDTAVCCFYNCKSLVETNVRPIIENADINGCFYGCDSLNDYDDLKKLSVPHQVIVPTGDDFVDLPNGIADLIIEVGHS